MPGRDWKPHSTTPTHGATARAGWMGASRQLLAEVREPLPMKPGQVERKDYEYQREGVCNLFLWCEPLGNRRHVEGTERRTKGDWAQEVKDLVDTHHPEAERIVFVSVMDNLNTHTPAR